MRIGVTGGSGFIGRSLLRRLCANADLKPIVLTRTPRDTPGVVTAEWVQGDLASAADCARFVSGLDVLIHLAHVNSPLTSNRDLPADAAANLVPSLNLLQAIRAQSRRVKIIYASSGGALYRPRSSELPYTEDDPVEPYTAYGIMKATTESYLRMASDEGWLDATVLRIGNAYGAPLPRERLQGFIGVAVHEIAAGRPVRIFGNPNNVRDYVHLDDIACAFERALDARQGYTVYNIGSGVGTSVRAVVDLLRELSPANFSVKDVSEQEPADRLPSWAVLDVSRAFRELSWSPQIELRAGLQRLLESMLG